MKQFIKKHTNLLTAIFINIFFLLFILLTCNAHYEITDDWYFADNIANGNYDYTFCSYFIQALTGIVQKFIYPYNAFNVLQVVFGFISMTTMSYVFLESFDKKKGLLYVFIIESMFAVNVYCLITFTKTAAFLCVAGGLLMLWAYHNKKPLGYWFFGIILIIFGSFYRYKIFYSVLAVFFCFICGLLINKLKKFNLKSILELAKEVLTFKTVALVLAMVLLVFSINLVSKEIIYSGEGMEYYREYNPMRSAVHDYPLPDYYADGMSEKYNEIGISENEYVLLKNWYLDDKGFSSVEKLEKILELQSENKDSITKILFNMVRSEALNVYNMSPSGILIVSYLILAIAVLALYEKKSFTLVATITAAIGILYLYLWIEGRVVYRATTSIWLAATVCLLYSAGKLEYREWFEKIKENKKLGVTAVSLILIVVLPFVSLFAIQKRFIPHLSISYTEGLEELEEYMLSNDDKTFVLGRKAVPKVRPAFVVHNPLVFDESDAWDNCVYFGSAYYTHPSYIEMLENVGVTNLYTDIIDNDTMYFVDYYDADKPNADTMKDVDRYLCYVNERYSDGSTYGYELVETIGDFGFYKIITVN